MVILLYKDDMRYLTARINYEGLASTEQNVKLLVRIIDPNGVLCRGKTGSPVGFTFTSSIMVKPGEEPSDTFWLGQFFTEFL